MATLSFLYGIILFALTIGAFFVVYHILKYSLNEALGYIGCIVFGAVFCLLFFINFLSFQALDTTGMLPALDFNTVTPTTLSPTFQTKNNPW